jgi:sRNA-binding carbon storage regulator CsrA
MLIVRRKPLATITVDGPCVIHLLDVRQNNVYLGIEADKSVKIDAPRFNAPALRKKATAG